MRVIIFILASLFLIVILAPNPPPREVDNSNLTGAGAATGAATATSKDAKTSESPHSLNTPSNDTKDTKTSETPRSLNTPSVQDPNCPTRELNPVSKLIDDGKDVLCRPGLNPPTAPLCSPNYSNGSTTAGGAPATSMPAPAAPGPQFQLNMTPAPASVPSFFSTPYSGPGVN